MITRTDVGDLKAQLVESGAFRFATAATWTKFLGMLACLAGLLWLCLWLPWWCSFALVPLAAIPAVTAAMVGHEASHGSFSASATHNRIMEHLAFPLFTGLGALHWRKKHNEVHHGHPNVDGVDNDVDLWPMALSSHAHEQSGPLRRFLQRYFQGYLFFPLTLFLAFVMRVETMKTMVGRARAGQIDRAWWMDAACQLAHYAVWLVLPMIWLGPLTVALYYVALWASVGVVLALIFAPGHIGLPIVSQQRPGWLHQLHTTRNLRLPRWASWFFVGLDYQVEHHLFPRIPHQRMPTSSTITREWMKKHGAPYHELPYLQALGSVSEFMFVGWKTEPVELA